MSISLTLSPKEHSTGHLNLSWVLCAMLLLAIPIMICRAAEEGSTAKTEGAPVRIRGYLFKWLPRPPYEFESGLIIDEAKERPNLVEGRFYLDRDGEAYLLSEDIAEKLRDKSPRILTFDEELAFGMARSSDIDQIFSNTIAIIEGRATHLEVVVTDVAFEGSRKDLEKLAEEIESMVNPIDALALKAASQENLEIRKYLEHHGEHYREQDIEVELLRLQGIADSFRKIAIGKVQWQDVVDFMRQYNGQYLHLENVITDLTQLQKRKPKAQVEWERLVRKNPQEAIDLVKAFKDQDKNSRQLALDAVVTSLSWSSPDKAVELLITSAEDRYWKGEVLDAILENWAAKNVNQVVAWIETIKDHDNMADVTKALFRHSNGYFPSFKGPSPERDDALSLASSLKSQEQRAIALATILQPSIRMRSHTVNSFLFGIKDINEQAEVVFYILSNYGYQDTGEKDRWFKALPLELKERVDLRMKEKKEQQGKRRRDERNRKAREAEPKSKPDPNLDF